MIEDEQNDPAPASMFDAAAWERREREHSRRFGELPAGKQDGALQTPLPRPTSRSSTSTSMATAIAGKSRALQAKRGDEVMELPVTQIEIVTPVWDSPNTNRQTMDHSRSH